MTLVACTGWNPPRLDPYPERPDPKHHWLDPVEAAVLAGPRMLGTLWQRMRARAVVRAVRRHGAALSAMDEAALVAECAAVRQLLRRAGETAGRGRGLALVRELAHRRLGLRPHDVQLLGALALLDGAVAEMDTGEGKTLTAALAAGLAALAGTPVHVITVNDYLAERDAASLAPFYAALGLRHDIVVHGRDEAARRRAYAADVVHASNKEIAFDYLRDRLRLARRRGALPLKLGRMVGAPDAAPVMHGLAFAIVDEADSVLIDEARTPLILSRETDAAAERDWAETALGLATRMKEGEDYRIRPGERRIELTKAGRKRAEALAAPLGGIWSGRIRREESLRQALSALHLFKPGDHYLIRDDKVEIVDEYTGRIMADRSWSAGLHQLIEAKEGVTVTAQKLTLAQLTYQRFFRRYRRLAGMTGTAREVGAEFWSVYRLQVARIPPNVPSRLDRGRVRVCRNDAARQEAIVARVRELVAAGRPVLVGTRSVRASQSLSSALRAAGMDHAVLNAEHDSEEAQIIAEAGAPGRVTVATNMAGRGVDIGLAPEVVDRGGLHVILSQKHDARRIDRQLEGRAGRRGQLGSAEAILSLEDELLALAARHPLRGLARLPGRLGQAAGRRIFRLAQRRAERAHFRARVDLLEQDRRMGTVLAFAGGNE